MAEGREAEGGLVWGLGKMVGQIIRKRRERSRSRCRAVGGGTRLDACPGALVLVLLYEDQRSETGDHRSEGSDDRCLHVSLVFRREESTIARSA